MFLNYPKHTVHLQYFCISVRGLGFRFIEVWLYELLIHSHCTDRWQSACLRFKEAPRQRSKYNINILFKSTLYLVGDYFRQFTLMLQFHVGKGQLTAR